MHELQGRVEGTDPPEVDTTEKQALIALGLGEGEKGQVLDVEAWGASNICCFTLTPASKKSLLIVPDPVPETAPAGGLPGCHSLSGHLLTTPDWGFPCPWVSPQDWELLQNRILD